jgi:hypothetical protein
MLLDTLNVQVRQTTPFPTTAGSPMITAKRMEQGEGRLDHFARAEA